MRWTGTSWPSPSGLPTTSQRRAKMYTFKTSDAQCSKGEVTTRWCHCRSVVVDMPAALAEQGAWLCANTCGCLWQPIEGGANVPVVHQYRYSIDTACFFTTICTAEHFRTPARWNSLYIWLDNWITPNSKPEDWCSEVLHDFLQRFQANDGIVPQIKSRPLPSASFSFLLFGYTAWATECVVKQNKIATKTGQCTIYCGWLTRITLAVVSRDWVRSATLYKQ